MSRRSWISLAVFSACLAVVLAGVAWISFTALELVDREEHARRLAAEEENVRLALWRMDSSIAPIIASESARPYFTYVPFYPAERAYNRMFAEASKEEVLVASPLLAEPPERVFIHFQIDPAGALTSPEAPAGDLRLRAIGEGLDEAVLASSEGRLGELRAVIADGGELRNRLPLDGKKTNPDVASQLAQNMQAPQTQRGKSSFEWAMRSKSVEEASSYNANPYPTKVTPSRAQESDKVRSIAYGNIKEGPVEPVWIGSSLVLARRLRVDGLEYVQGCWLDWPRVRASLLADIRDLLPYAELVPSKSKAGAEERRLASLPVQLVAGDVPLPDDPSSRLPVGLVLGAAWFAVLLAAAAVVALLVGTIALSERRAVFVSAVTHELRTPLTTFRMYSEMLAEGMIADEAKRKSYVETLRREAIRLSHLVENVLAYARIERGRAGGRVEAFALGDVVDRFRDRLRDRADQAGMALSVEITEEQRKLAINADATAVEQILFNLVDNACKYAASATDKRIHLSAGSEGARTIVRVRDHGTGLSVEARRRLFSAFSKSAERAATSAPGVGLGLALSRRLARSMGGDLRYDPPRDGGAGFVLSLPS